MRARYVVGADGPRSLVRSLLGIGVQHLGTLGSFALVVFRADLSALSDGLVHGLNLIEHADASGVLLPAGADRWVFSPPWSPAQGRPEDRPAGYWADVLRVATGLPTLRPDITSVTRFTMAAEVATAYRSGPGFLAGDAAHRMTPVGGRGMNTAVHDGHELGWRLAWAARGLAGEALLDSYETERAPVGRANAERSLRMGQPDPGDGLGADLLSTYRSDVIAAERAGHVAARIASPGRRAPHAWVRRDGRRVSTLDLFEGRLTLLTGPEGSAWVDAAEQVDAPVQALVAGVHLADPRGALRRAYRLRGTSAVLVRPDGVVAWRHDGRAGDPAGALTAAVDTALGRVPVRQAVAV